MIDTIIATVQKLEGLLDRAEGLLSAGLIQDDALAAVRTLTELIILQRDEINALSSVADPDVVAVRCDSALAILADHTPLLGFVHRSKSSANPFEVYGPLRALARKVITPDVRLVMSSEWDFSPFTMPHGTTLKGFVFVGMPATIAEKALLIPLAGHEFGHSVWNVQNCEPKVQQLLQPAIWNQIRARLAEALQAFGMTKEADLLTREGRRRWQPARQWASQQAQEIFCDLVGLRLFGASYAYAFVYLIAPGLSAYRPWHYPHPRNRVEILASAASKWGIHLPPALVALFPATKTPGSFEPFLGDVADAAALEVVPQLISLVEAHASSCSVALPRPNVVADVVNDLKMVVPADKNATLAEVICGGWEMHNDPLSWASLPHIAATRHRVLDELLLKSAEIVQFHEHLARNRP